MDFGRDGRVAGAGVLARRRRPITLLVIVAAILAALVLLEGSNTTTITGEPAARPRSRNRLLANTNPFAGLPSVFNNAFPGSSGSLAGVTNEQAALNTAKQTADANVATAQQTAALAGENAFPGFVSAIVCPILLQARAQIVTTFNALEAQFPQLAGQLAAIEAAALAVIDALLVQFQCVVSP